MFLSKSIQSKQLAVTAVAAVGLIVLRLLKKKAQKRRLPPGDRGNVILGEFLKYVGDTHGFFTERLAKFGGTFLTNLFFKDTVVLKPSAANLKLMSSQNKLGWPNHFLEVIGQTALAMVNGAIHKKQRSSSGRAFNAKMLDTYLSSFQSLTMQHLERWTSAEKPKEMREDIKFYTFELAQQVLLGVDLPEAKSRHMMDLMGTTIEGLSVMFPVNLPGFHYRKVLAARRKLVALYQEIIEEKRSNPVQIPNSMIDYVMGVDGNEAEGMNDLELQDFCVNMSFAGHDTTLATIQSLLYYLSLHPTVLAELRLEVDAAWDGKVAVSRALLQSLVKCQAFIMEIFRLLPPVPFMARELSTATTVDGYELPAGMTIMFGVKSIMDHHFAEQGQCIDNLELGRWFDADGKFVGQAKLYDLASFSVFGAGGRMCIGYKFAMDEIIVFLMNLLRSFDFTVTEAEKQTFPFAYWKIKAAFHKRASDGVAVRA